ncbi:hypothetical protein [Catenulispora subtropica]
MASLLDNHPAHFRTGMSMRAVALEFLGLDDGRSFDALLASIPGHRVRRLDLLDRRIGSPHASLRDRARALMPHMDGDGRVLIMAYCSGAGLALTLADELGADLLAGVMLIDPQAVTLDDVTSASANLAIKLGAADAPEVSVGDFEPWLDSLIAQYCDFHDLRDDERDLVATELRSLYVSWLGFLSSSVAPQTIALAAPVHVVHTRDDVDLSSLLDPGTPVIRHFQPPDPRGPMGGDVVRKVLREAVDAADLHTGDSGAA